MSLHQTESFIIDVLKKHQVPFQQDDHNGVIFTAFEIPELGIIHLNIQVKEQGAWLDICTSKLLKVDESVYKGILFQTVLIHAWETPMVRFFYNPQTGYLSASIDVLLADMVLTEKALIDGINFLIRTLTKVMPRLKSVLATGEDPGRKSPLEQAIEQMPPKTLEQIAQLIAQRQQQGGPNQV